MEFRKFLDTIEAEVPDDRDVHLIADNYATHQTALIRNWFAKRPRFHLHFTPTSASWLNLVERRKQPRPWESMNGWCGRKSVLDALIP